MTDFYRQNGAGARKLDWLWQGHFPLGKSRGLSVRQITALALIGWISISGRTKTNEVHLVW